MVRATPDEIARLVRRLLKSWRDPEWDDERAQAHSAAVTRIFASYPPEVLETVVRTLPDELSYYPTIAEVAQACDRAAAPLHRRAAEDLAAWELRQFIAPIEREPVDYRASVVDRLWPEGSRFGDDGDIESDKARHKRVADMIAEGTDRRWRTPKSDGSTPST